MPYTKEQRNTYNQQRRDEIRKIIAEQKAHPCVDCGIQYPVFVMQFDHVRGEKRFNIGRATTKIKSIQTLLEEISKCDLVCANCHAIRTAKTHYSHLI
jgi:hypothetical protein